MSKDYTNEIGYESLLSDFKRYQKQTPRGVGMAKKAQNIYLQFKTPNSARKQYACGCTFTLDGMVEALKKSNKVAEALKNLTSEVEFWQWYDKEIKQESQLVDDRLTFGEAIAKVEADFWNRASRTQRERDKSNPSDTNSWRETYGRFLEALPSDSLVDLLGIELALKGWTRGRRSYKYAVSAYKKMCRVIECADLLSYLDGLDTVQTKTTKLQSVNMNDFLDWRAEVLGTEKELHSNVRLDIRRPWLWAFSVQVVYGLRISEVFAIENLTKPYVTEDNVRIPALNDPGNANNVIVISATTLLGTSTKTGYRLARPQIPPSYPDLIERLSIKSCLLPDNKPVNGNDETIRKFYGNKARRLLAKWNAPFTQTHALRHLANINGIQAGIPQEVRAQSLGHTVQMNESVYKKRQSTQTTIDLLLNSNSNAIDFVSALAEAKKLVKGNESDKQVIARLLSIIYQKNETEICELL